MAVQFWKTEIKYLFAQMVSSAIGRLVIIVVVNQWLLLPIVLLGVLLHFLRICYLRTSRQVKRLDAKSRSHYFKL